MAIQMRRGEYSKFDAESMLPGEWAVVLESDPNGTGGRSLYMCFSPGVVKRIATVEDMATIIANAEPEVSGNIMKIATDTNDSISAAEAKRVEAENGRVAAARDMAAATDEASSAAKAANEAAEAAKSAAARKVWLDYDEDGYISLYEVES